MKIVVLCGGESPERDVSLESGLAVAVALVELGHEVQVVDPAAAEPVRVGPTAIESELPRTAVELRGPELDEGKRRELMLAALTTGPVLPLLRAADLVFPALHGGWGGDGHVQALLEMAGVPFAGAPSAQCSLAWDKRRTLALLREAGVTVTDSVRLTAGSDRPMPQQVSQWLAQGPVVVKSNTGTSHLELRVADDADGLARACSVAPAGEELIATPFLPGREFTVSVIEDGVLPVVEIEYAGRLFDYETKSHPQTARCHCPADLPYDLDEGLREQAMRAHRALGLGAKDYSRVDFRCDGRGVPHCLEVNACPGLRPLSGLGAAAAGAGWSYRELVGRVVALRAPVGVPALAG
ncbi:D-alanine--D-alanine ligase family protein [Streptomyces sp. NBC_00069]|uniref:D-alanine--D-alanine ligase family protein n=1 Tax=Streptomyces sp. NBC_00069 TaxID=2975639 RepID=UPI0032562E84|nr:D-alanine--D-alanine ligase [Streptomyces sp. NBC_00998]